MMKITATEFKANLGKYLVIAGHKDVHITKNGSDIAVLTAPKSKYSWVDDLTGIIKYTDIDEKYLKSERLAQKYESLD